ncbi:MauE/DoxX family redox-associated membrane protein [Arachidicoccus terrestris]|uniref:MauE/DoxX family redox-associated membrane protein n=1 Tax=Arachidicoccus terrestris TaxID=2875539 RepID=UPI001CC680AB|nr:MauE/DoxX family redox-associated membrane protein [Arachidicoccus terrestris]UAY56023.1 hypothetical protein K9M52_03050 [Arachidicoccus terrestris]
MKRSLIISIICSLLILLWIYAAGSKLLQYDIFKMQLSKQPLPEWSLSILTWALPSVEILTVALLCFQRTTRIGLLLSLLLMSCFTIYVGLALGNVFGDLPCACGGIFQILGWRGHLVLNLIFTAVAATGYYLQIEKGRNTNYLDIRTSRASAIE